MLSRIREQVGTAGLIVAIVALVAGLSGAAYAAKGVLKLSPQQKKEVRKIAKQETKKAAKPGPQGPKGDTGAQGAPGPAGKDGQNGQNGQNGKSVVVNPENPGANCSDGGVAVTVEGSEQARYVCNGTTGFTATLPSGQTETGTWGGHYPEGTTSVEPISFSIPLATAPEPVFVGGTPAEKEQGEAEGCPGLEPNGTPTAEPGKLCVYYGLNFQGLVSIKNVLFLKPSEAEVAVGADTTGTALYFECKGETHEDLCVAGGVWAVTAE